MQKTLPSRALSLILTLLLCLGVFATVQTASTTGWAKTIADGSGTQYQINFASSGTTATLNGITATTEVEADLDSDGWGWNPETNREEQGERVSFAVCFSGTAQSDGRLTVTITGTTGNGGTFTDFIEVYVHNGEAITNNIGNTLFSHLSMNAMMVYGSLNDLETTLSFDPMDTYELYLSNLNVIESNGVYFTFWAGGNGGGGGYFAMGEDVGLDLWANGTAARAGRYTVNVSSGKAGINATRTLNVNARGSVDKNLMEDRDIEHETYFLMPDKDVDDFVFTVTFTPSGGGGSTTSSTSKGNSSSSGGGNTQPRTPTPTPVDRAAAVQSVKDAIAAAKNSHNGAFVSFKNPSTISLDVLREIAKTSGTTPLQLNADSLNADGTIDVRITIDPSKALNDLNLSASTTSIAAEKAKNKFEQYFNNSVSVVSLSQKGSFGMPVQVAAKVDPKLNVDTLVFYSYDSQTNTYTPITNPQYRIDSKGYVHFTTSLGGDIIIADKPFQKK